ncbi:MAG: ATP-binding protein [Solirubrobacteraceae bacterium]
MDEIQNVGLRLWGTSPCVAVVHYLLAAVAEELGLDAVSADGLQTATGEACKNVVLHAYEGEEGPLEVEVWIRQDAVEVLVRDDGIGIRPHIGERTGPHTGIGLPIVHLLTRRVTYTNMPAGGTEVRMLFELPGVTPPGAGPALPQPEEEPGEVLEMTICPGPLLARALPRALPALLGAAGASQGPPASELARVLADAAPAALGRGAMRVLASCRPDGSSELRLIVSCEDAAGQLRAAVEQGGPRLASLLAPAPAGAASPAQLIVRLPADS